MPINQSYSITAFNHAYPYSIPIDIPISKFHTIYLANPLPAFLPPGWDSIIIARSSFGTCVGRLALEKYQCPSPTSYFSQIVMLPAHVCPHQLLESSESSLLRGLASISLFFSYD